MCLSSTAPPQRVAAARLWLPRSTNQGVLLPLSEEYRHANRRRVQLTWRADHDERCLTLETEETLPLPPPAGAVADVDLGEKRIAAVTTTTRQALVVSGAAGAVVQALAQPGPPRAAGATEPLSGGIAQEPDA